MTARPIAFQARADDGTILDVREGSAVWAQIVIKGQTVAYVGGFTYTPTTIAHLPAEGGRTAPALPPGSPGSVRARRPAPAVGLRSQPPTVKGRP